MKPDLIIDSNERGSLCESIERKAKKAGLTVVRQTLVVGDYQLGGALVEAKSIPVLFQSSHSGHLWRQLDNMDANFERFFLVIHGSIAKYVAMAKRNGKKVSFSKVQSELTGTIARIMSDFECQVFFTTDVSTAAQFIVSIEEMTYPESLKQIKGLGDVRRKLLVDILTSEDPVKQERRVKR